MEINCYETLNLEKTEDGRESKHIRNGYESRLKELSDEYKKEYHDLIQKQDKEIMTLEYLLKNIRSQNQANNNKDRIKEIKEEHKKQIAKLKTDYEAKRKKIIGAYKQLATKGLREIYEENKEYNSTRLYLNGNTAYDFFAISEQEIYSLNADKADSIIKEVYDKFVECYERAITDPEVDEEIKIELKNDLLQAQKYYKKICDMNSRMQYKDELDLMEKTEKIKINEAYIKQKCSKVDQFDPYLIKSVKVINSKKVKALLYKRSTNPVTLSLPDKKNRDILLAKTGEILFKTSSDDISSYISEYEVSRIVNGKEIIDRIYANLDLTKLSIDEENNIPNNSEYYDCVVNELLSEVVIRGSKYNKGYVGGVEKNKNGQYQIILAKKELDSIEKEELAAVMIYAEQQEEVEEKKESDEGR